MMQGVNVPVQNPALVVVLVPDEETEVEDEQTQPDVQDKLGKGWRCQREELLAVAVHDAKAVPVKPRALDGHLEDNTRHYKHNDRGQLVFQGLRPISHCGRRPVDTADLILPEGLEVAQVQNDEPEPGHEVEQ